MADMVVPRRVVDQDRMVAVNALGALQYSDTLLVTGRTSSM